MVNAGIVVKVSSEEYRLLLVMRNLFGSVQSLREVLKNTQADDVYYGNVVNELLEQTS